MARYKRDNPSCTPFAISARALFVTINIPDHRPKARFSRNGPRNGRRIFRPPNNPDRSVKNRRDARRGRRDTTFLIHSPVTDIHVARAEEETPFFSRCPEWDPPDVTEMYWKALTFFHVSSDEYVWQVSVSTARQARFSLYTNKI